MKKFESMIAEALAQQTELINKFPSLLSKLEVAYSLLAGTFASEGIVYSCGNGGSAGDAMHLTSELINRFEVERRSLPAIALTLDSMTLTSIGNDRSYSEIYARPLTSLLKKNDLLVMFTTSGNSDNLLSALKVAHNKNSKVLCFNGRDGGRLSKLLTNEDCEIIIDSTSTARIQEQHLLCIHLLCQYLDRLYSSNIV